ncbi:MAG: dihydropteroate synthase [Chryseobacterium sp.]|nr:MAG: dihydropteroate synthase [Chryseobacterium sp.]
MEYTLNCRGKLIDLSRPKIMGILNLTPDSFSDGGRFNNAYDAVTHTAKMLEDGAEIIDIGAQSTRPRAEYLPAAEELNRLRELLPLLRRAFPETLFSLDSFYSEVVRFGADEGIDIINDISGGSYDPAMFRTVGEVALPYILMHVNVGYEQMHRQKSHDDILLSLNRYFLEKIHELHRMNVHDIILDPGFGFGKTLENQLQLIDEFQYLDFNKKPLLAGISRKSFIYKPLGKGPLEVNAETQKLHLRLLQKGAKILRVHDVAEAVETVKRFNTR